MLSLPFGTTLNGLILGAGLLLESSRIVLVHVMRI